MLQDIALDSLCLLFTAGISNVRLLLSTAMLTRLNSKKRRKPVGHASHSSATVLL
jgi:hypothetical protein